MHPGCGCCAAFVRVITKLVHKCAKRVRIIICLHCWSLGGYCSWGQNNSYWLSMSIKSAFLHLNTDYLLCFKKGRFFNSTGAGAEKTSILVECGQTVFSFNGLSGSTRLVDDARAVILHHLGK